MAAEPPYDHAGRLFGRATKKWIVARARENRKQFLWIPWSHRYWTRRGSLPAELYWELLDANDQAL
jgi:hypothetical protein